MYGEGGADRFLCSNNASEAYDSASDDAIVYFTKETFSGRRTRSNLSILGSACSMDRAVNTNLMADKIQPSVVL